MTRADNREPIIYPELDLHRRPIEADHMIRRAAIIALPFTIFLYGLLYAFAAVSMKAISFEWSWIILPLIYTPFIILGFCDTGCRERRNLDGTTEKRTGWPFRIALIWACIPPVAGFCFLVGMSLASQLQMEMESGYVISIGLFIAFIWYAIDMNRLLNH